MEECCKCMNEHIKEVQFASTSTLLCIRLLLSVCVQPVRSIFLTSLLKRSLRVCVGDSESVHVVFLVTLKTCLLLYCVFYKIMEEF